MDELNGWGHRHATDTQRIHHAQRMAERAPEVVRPRMVAAVQTFFDLAA